MLVKSMLVQRMNAQVWKSSKLEEGVFKAFGLRIPVLSRVTIGCKDVDGGGLESGGVELGAM